MDDQDIFNLEESLGKPMREMAWALLGSVGLYMLLPVLVAIILLAVLRVRGQAFKLIVILVAAVGFFLFIRFGLPQLTTNM